MQVTVEEAGAYTKRLKIVLPGEAVKKEMDKAFGKLASEVSIKGFRKGKVPRQVLEKNYAAKVKYELGEKLIQDTYFDALGETKLDAVTHPEIRSQEYGDDGSFVYEAEVAVRPDFELGQYKGLVVEHEEGAATEEEILTALESMRREVAPLRSVEDRGIQKDDVAVLDFQGFHEGKEMGQVKAQNYSVDIGSGRFGEEFEKCVMGMKAGEKTSREIDFPAEFPNPVLAGKKVEFKIEIKDIKERVLPELDDDFAREAGKEYGSLADLKKAIADKIGQEKNESKAGALADKLMMQLLERHNFEVPARLVAYEVNALIKEMENRLLAQNLTLESAGVKRDELVEQYRDVATKRVKGDFILKKIAEAEGIKLVDADIDNGFKRIAQQYNMKLDEVRKYFASRDDLLPFMNELLSEKIINFLRENAVITPPAVTTTETVEA
ncbi:MAG TPA: trigger factor [Desulfurivibrionaceae bacterium]|nr:trigger factor [Desulfurivibrionaceae bacterium]